MTRVQVVPNPSPRLMLTDTHFAIGRPIERCDCSDVVVVLKEHSRLCECCPLQRDDAKVITALFVVPGERNLLAVPRYRGELGKLRKSDRPSSSCERPVGVRHNVMNDKVLVRSPINVGDKPPVPCHAAEHIDFRTGPHHAIAFRARYHSVAGQPRTSRIGGVF